MKISVAGRVVSAVSASIMLLSAFQQSRKPEEEFVGIMLTCGLSMAAAQPLAFGACCLYTATVG